MNRILFLTAFACLLTACGHKPQPQDANQAISSLQNVPGDSTRYGLACDGSTDSILVLLPNEGGDPDTFDIISAFQKRRLYGRPHIGDKLAVITRQDSTATVVHAVINMSALQGDWCYQVSPTLRPHLQNMPPLPDSIRQRIMAPRQYTIRLKNGGIAFSMGGRQAANDDMSPVEYPQQKRYTHWQLFNGHLVLLTDSASKQQPDTADILLLRRDTLVLRFADHEQSYYKK